MSRNIDLARYLGRPSADLLNAEPFSTWTPERTVEDDLNPPETSYSYADEVGFEFNCCPGESIAAIFLYRGGYVATAIDLDTPFEWSREMVISRLGRPSKSGNGTLAWDRYDDPVRCLHFEYDAQGIRMITWMRPDRAP